jgi:ERF superfamily
MGAALTYARRYALFTLVGIAGEDDLDAPDLVCDGLLSPSPPGLSHSSAPSDGKARVPPRAPGNGRSRRGMKGELPVILDAAQSAALQEKLLREIGDITSAELATNWARGALAAKNSLTSADAVLVEEAFERRLSELPSLEAAATSNDASSRIQAAEAREAVSTASQDPGQATGIDKSILTVAAPRRYRNREHLRYIAQQPCLVCARKPSDPHHLRFMQPRALGLKASDEFVVPLCRVHHRAVHRASDERAWWKQISIDPLKVARKLWKQTRVNEGRIRPDQTPQSDASDQPLEAT